MFKFKFSIILIIHCVLNVLGISEFGIAYFGFLEGNPGGFLHNQTNQTNKNLVSTFSVPFNSTKTENYEKLQSAINWLGTIGGGILYIYPGTYTISNQIIINSISIHITSLSEKCSLKLEPGSAALAGFSLENPETSTSTSVICIINTSSIRISKIRIIGTIYDIKNTLPYNGISISNSSNIVIETSDIIFCRLWAITLNTTSGIIIRDNYIDQNSNAIKIENSDHIVLQINTIMNTTGNENEGRVYLHHVNMISITHNMFHGKYFYMIILSSVSYCNITDNLYYENPQFIHLINDCFNVVIHNNRYISENGSGSSYDYSLGIINRIPFYNVVVFIFFLC